MTPFWSAAGTSFHWTKMLVELLLCPLTSTGAAAGSDVNKDNIILLLSDDYESGPVYTSSCIFCNSCYYSYQRFEMQTRRKGLLCFASNFLPRLNALLNKRIFDNRFNCNNSYCYIPRLSLNKTSIAIGWFLVACPRSNSNVSRPGHNCPVVARAPNTTARDQCMTNLKMAWSSARAHVSLIDWGGPESTASFQFQPAIIDNGT